MVRAGISGAGLMGGWHARTIQRIGGQVVGFHDSDSSRAHSSAACLPRAQTFDSLESLLEQVEVLHVCSPLPAHYDAAATALARGVYTIVEKPIAPRWEDVEKLLAMAASNGVWLCPVFQYLFQDGVQRVAAEIERAGEIVELKSRIASAGAEKTPELADALVAEILPHPLSLFCRLFPASLAEVRWQVGRHRSGELRAAGEAAGVALQIEISMNARPAESTFTIAGTQGTFTIDLFHGFSYFLPGRFSRLKKILLPFEQSSRKFEAASANLLKRAVRREPAYPGLRRLLGACYRAIETRAAPPISPETTLMVAQVRDEILALREQA